MVSSANYRRFKPYTQSLPALEAQTSRVSKSKSKKFSRPKQIDKRDCQLVSYSTIGNKVVTAHYNCPANVTNLILSQNEIVASCSSSNSCSDKSQLIKVRTEMADPENDVVTYIYEISGGEIVGVGARVIWDLSSVKPGTYRITAGVDDSCGVCGKTVTKEVKVVECPDCK